jgi:hypothetical protein
VGANGQQGIFTPLRHLIPLPVFSGVHVSPFVYLTRNSYFNFETDYSSVSWPFEKDISIFQSLFCYDMQTVFLNILAKISNAPLLYMYLKNWKTISEFTIN